jgi:hypothetical protein
MAPTTVSSYQHTLRGKPFVPATTNGRATLGADGVPNKLFIAFLFSDNAVSTF